MTELTNSQKRQEDFRKLILERIYELEESNSKLERDMIKTKKSKLQTYADLMDTSLEFQLLNDFLNQTESRIRTNYSHIQSLKNLLNTENSEDIEVYAHVLTVCLDGYTDCLKIKLVPILSDLEIDDICFCSANCNLGKSLIEMMKKYFENGHIPTENLIYNAEDGRTLTYTVLDIAQHF